MRASQVELGNRIREQMDRVNASNGVSDKVTVATLATKVGVSEVYIRKIIDGTRSCSQEVQFAIAFALGCRVDEIFFIVKKPKTYQKIKH